MSGYDKKTVKEAMRGDKEAVNKLVEKSYRRIFYYAFKRFGQDAEDVTHKAIIEIITSLKNLTDPDKFEVWMMGLVRNVCNGEMRKKYRYTELFTSFDEEDSEFSLNLEGQEFLPEDYVIDAEKRERVLRIIDTLPENYRDVLQYYYFDEMSYEDIAEIMGVNWSKVKNDLYRGKLLLKKRLEEKEGKDFAMYSVAPFAVPALGQIFQADASAVVTPQLYAGALSRLQEAIAQLDLAPKGLGASVAGSAVVKTVVASMAALAVVGGAAVFFASGNPAPEQVPSPPPVSVAAPSPSSAPESSEEPFVIVTLADMIGEKEAAQLLAFETGPVDKSAWREFLTHIGADYDLSVSEFDYEYITYLLRKQDKQLFLAERKNNESGEITVVFQFGEITDPPRIHTIVMLFDEVDE